MSSIAEYNRGIRFKILFIIACVVACIALVAVSVSVSGLKIGFLEVYGVIFDHITGKEFEGTRAIDDYIIWEVNLPRAIFAIVAGTCLAVSGAVMQSMMKNPFVDSYTTGISAGACLGIAVAIILGMSLTEWNGFGVIINSFIFALIPMVLIVMMSPSKRASPATIVLIGISLSYFFNAVNSMLLSMASTETLAQIYMWQVGSFFSISWRSVPIPAVFVIIGTAVLIIISKKLNVIALDDNEATSLGLNVENLRIGLLVLISLMVAAVVSFAGAIGFVGLIVPHIVRMILGSDNRLVIPATAAFGAAFLLGCDIVCRLLNNGAVPVGVLVSLVGAPIFIAIIMKSKNAWWY